MEKTIEQRATIRFCWKAGFNATKTCEMIQKVMVSLLYIVLQCFIRARCFQKGESRFLISREAKDRRRQESTKNCSCSRYFEGRSSVFVWTQSKMDRNTKNYRATNFVWRFTEMEIQACIVNILKFWNLISFTELITNVSYFFHKPALS